MPARFDFRLAPLLDHRKRVEEEKQREFAACRRAIEECRREIERLGGQRRRSIEQLVGSVRTQSARELRLRDAHLRRVELAIDDERLRQGELSVAYERARDELIAASRERRIVEKLKERRYRAYQAEAARCEEIELDEANARRREKCRA
ncbi:MAG: flagellar export protein FliJ [Candidatus Cybelea sp.]